MTAKTILHSSPNRSPKNARVFHRSSSQEIFHDDDDEVQDDIRKMLDNDISSLENYGRALVFTSNEDRGKKLFHSLLRFGVYSDVVRSPEKFIEFFVFSLSRRPYDFGV